MHRKVVAGGSLLLVVVLAAHACQPLVIAHGGKNPRWALRGGHSSVACEQCHGTLNQGCLGTEKPEPQSTSCMDCHWEDVPPGAEHYPGQECFPCHVEDGWDVGLTPTAPEPTPPDTGPPPDTGGTTAFDHGTLALDRLCWDCHEIDSLDVGIEDRRPFGHYMDVTDYEQDQTYWWDCGPCHTTVSWTDDTLFQTLHPVRTPHGTHDNLVNLVPMTEWIVACADCHNIPGDYTKYTCDNCHEELWVRGHKNVVESDPDSMCWGGCHPIGDQP